MSKGFKLLWIVTVVVVIGFSMTSCDDSCCPGGSASEITINDIPYWYLNSFLVISMQFGSSDNIVAMDFGEIKGDSHLFTMSCTTCGGPYALNGRFKTFIIIYADASCSVVQYTGQVAPKKYSQTNIIEWDEID